MGNSELVTVATFTYPNEAYSLKGRLEAEDIRCFIENENIVTANPLYSNAVGGVQIRVKKEDETRALDIITETKKSVKNEYSSEMPSDEEILALPKEPVTNGDSGILKFFGRFFR
jgi:hypothetical protein